MSATTELLVEQLQDIENELLTRSNTGLDCEHLIKRRALIIQQLESTRTLSENKQILKG